MLRHDVNPTNRLLTRWKNITLGDHRATLIQEITEYHDIVYRLLRDILPDHAYLGLSEEDCFKWIVREEIEEVYHLFDRQHIHGHASYSLIHNRVSAAAEQPLSRYTTHYIKAPQIFGENNIVHIDVIGPDLWIDYTRSVYQPLI